MFASQLKIISSRREKITWSGVFQREVFVCEFAAIDALASGTIVISEVTSLTHKIIDDSMEDASLVSKTLLASAECAEVFYEENQINVIHMDHINLSYVVYAI